ncbi:MAG TPA: PIN domain-containing protein [Baekduia sp.]|uniref:type II toxin-antitoxin system VapC family toxin n=1 Tax=Baekduia sp. TaxID=2600305 RepID=UPI002D7A080E|nr:PIN domain-containing protein [Baekduia sp.]HET6508618.1 PIN domain-containing protein [Baekduia sp.]
MAVALLDSSAVIAYIDRGDSLHDDAASAIESAVRAGSLLAISVIAWSELLHGAVLGHHPEEAIREFAHDFGVDIVDVDRDTAEHAIALQAAYNATGRKREQRKLRTPDALILATHQQHAEIDQVICGDVQWTKVPGIEPGAITLLTDRLVS